MKEVDDRISEIRSDEVQEILTRIPNWTIRWGSTLILGLIGLLLFLFWIIEYPDVIPGEVMITTKIPPVKMVSKTNGPINKIYLRDGSPVKKGDFILEIRSSINIDAIKYLENKSLEIKNIILNPNIDKDLESDLESGAAHEPLLDPQHKQSKHISFNDKHLVFGEMQSEYNNLKSLVQEYQSFLDDDYRKQKLKNLRKQLNHHHSLFNISDHQVALAKNNLQQANEKRKSDKKLYKKGAISKASFFEREKEFTAYLQEIENLKKTTLQYQVTITEYEKQFNDIRYEFSEKERVLIEKIMESIDKLKNFIHIWEQDYVLTASFDGTVSYLSNLYENQFIQAGAPLVAVIPNNNEYVGNIELPSQGAGKVLVGQKVNLMLNNYPYNEYGQIIGTISEIAPIASTNSTKEQLVYMVKVKLSNELVTTYNKKLKFKPEMSGHANIITEDLSLLARVFNQFRKTFDK